MKPSHRAREHRTREAIEFRAKPLHQRPEIAKIDFLATRENEVLVAVYGQVIRTGIFQEKVFNEAFNFKLLTKEKMQELCEKIADQLAAREVLERALQRRQYVTLAVPYFEVLAAAPELTWERKLALGLVKTFAEDKKLAVLILELTSKLFPPGLPATNVL